jgi:hypothetical protein
MLDRLASPPHGVGIGVKPSLDLLNHILMQAYKRGTEPKKRRELAMAWETYCLTGKDCKAADRIADCAECGQVTARVEAARRWAEEGRGGSEDPTDGRQISSDDEGPEIEFPLGRVDLLNLQPKA